VASALRALSMMDRRNVFSSVSPMFSLPRGLIILGAGTILRDPIDCAMEVMAQTWAVGSPAFSSSRVSVAPQRVLVPHVDVRIAPDTPAFLRLSAMAVPILIELAELVATPVVE